MILFLIIYQQYFLPKSVEVYSISSLGKKPTHKQKYLLIKSFCFSSPPQVGELLMWFQELLRHLFAIRLFPSGPHSPHFCRGPECWCSKTSLNQQLCSRPKWGLSGHSSIPTANSHNLFNVSNIFSWKIFSYSVIYFCLFWACIIIQDST